MRLAEYVRNHTVRGACTCGQCLAITEDGGLVKIKNPEQHQPTGHTADVHFFKVATRNAPTKDEFEELVRAEFPHWLDGKEHGYMEMGGDIGDQGIALQTQALGSLVGAWELLTPESMLGEIFGKDMLDMMAGRGMITVRVTS